MKEVITEWVGQPSIHEGFSTLWWKQKDEDQYKHLFSTVRLLETNQSFHSLRNLQHARFYSSTSVLGSHASSPGMTQQRPIYAANDSRISINVVKACIDTALNKISKARPRPMFLTEGGNWVLQQKGKKLTKFIDGLFDAMGIYEQMQKVFLDSLIFGTGALKIFPDEQQETVACERVIIDEIMVDDLEAERGSTKSIYQRRLVSKDVLKELYPDKLREIEEATSGISNYAGNSEQARELVKVIEAWHLPSTVGAKDGKHTIAIDTCVLFTERYEEDFFPFVFLRWTHKVSGFWGLGIAESLAEIQREINVILRNIQENMKLVSNNRIYVENNSQVSLQHLNNVVGAVVKYTGQPPIISITPAMSADVYQHLWALYAKAFEQEGISQLASSGVKPEGLNSGVALREFSDIESDRFQIAGQRYEQAFMDAAKISIHLMKKMDKKSNVKVKVEENGSVKFLNFKEVELKEDQYILRVFPSSLLPTRPSAKMQTIVEYAQAGFIDKETAMDLMDFPDIQAATSRAIAPRRIIFKLLDQIMETGEYQPPEPFFNLQLAKIYSQQYYLSARLDGAPEDRLDLIRTFMSDIDGLVELANQALMEEQQQQTMLQAQQANPNELDKIPPQQTVVSPPTDEQFALQLN